MTDNAREILARLYKIPIETLGLSDRTITILRWQGITSVADCLFFYYEDAHRTRATPRTLISLMYSEVKAKLEGRGYWALLQDNTIWNVLDRPIPETRMIMPWQGIDQDLYEIPIEQLNFSIRVFNSLKRTGLSRVGDIMCFFVGRMTAEYSDHNHPQRSSYDDLEIHRHVYGEVEQALKEHGYLSFIMSLA